MRKWLRRIRGAIGMGLTWGAAWAGAGFLLAVVTLLVMMALTGPEIISAPERCR